MRISQHIKRAKEVCALHQIANIAQRREVLDCKANAVEKGDLSLRAPPGCLALNNFPKLLNRIIIGQLLNFAFNPGLWMELNKISERKRISRCSSVLPGQSPPMALICTPEPTMLSVKIMAYCLSAVQVVTMSAPSMASSSFCMP